MSKYDTKVHIFNAGRELLLAAQGALSFCREYVTSGKEHENPQLAHFFSRALRVAEELGKDLEQGAAHKQKKPKRKKRSVGTSRRAG